MMKKRYILCFLAIFFWSTVATVTKLLFTDFSSLQVLWASSFFAALFLLVVNLLTGKIRILRTYRRRDYLISVLIGFPGTFLYYMFYYMGAERMPASEAFIINYMWPIMCVIFACIVLKERMTWRKGIAIAVSFFGVMIVAGGELQNLNHTAMLGALFCVLGAMSYGVFTAFNQKMNYDKSISLMLSYVTTFTVTTIINAVRGDLFLPSFVQGLGIAWNGAFTMALANTAWMLALEKGNTAKVSNLAYITPFVSLVWTSLILKETITLRAVGGLIVIILGILIQLQEGKGGARKLSATKA